MNVHAGKQQGNWMPSAPGSWLLDQMVVIDGASIDNYTTLWGQQTTIDLLYWKMLIVLRFATHPLTTSFTMQYPQSARFIAVNYYYGLGAFWSWGVLLGGILVWEHFDLGAFWPRDVLIWGVRPETVWFYINSLVLILHFLSIIYHRYWIILFSSNPSCHWQCANVSLRNCSLI